MVLGCLERSIPGLLVPAAALVAAANDCHWPHVQLQAVCLGVLGGEALRESVGLLARLADSEEGGAGTGKEGAQPLTFDRPK